MDDSLNFTPRNEDEYLKTRVIDQINWYDKSSAKNKRWFLSFKVLEIILAALIPFLSAYIESSESPLKMIVGILGIIVAVIAGLITLIKFQENWIEYRTVAESLKLEKFLFLAQAGPYKNVDNAFSFFVERFESLISNSTKKWVNYISKGDDESKAKTLEK